MLVKSLPAPITASKADWLRGIGWLGFTPAGGDQAARSQCQSTVTRQFGSGYVLEYITKQFGKPNAGFERDSSYLRERDDHKELAGRLIAVHKLRASALPLEDIIGRNEYAHLQDKWAQNGNRFRWSVAFPAIETYSIVNRPEAKVVFGEEAYSRIYQQRSALLRVLNKSDRAALMHLEIEPDHSPNAWIGIESDIRAAERSEINPRTIELISRDLDGALEGMSEEQKSRMRRRAAWLADKFVRHRGRAGTLKCDTCAFDPRGLFTASDFKPRSLLDVHHKNPLDEGIRYTTTSDFALLCPTCHRIEHLRLKLGGPPTRKSQAVPQASFTAFRDGSRLPGSA